MSIFLSPDAWISLVTLTLMEIVLGVDNIIFVAILVGRLPDSARERTRRLGIALALVFRLGLLFALTWMMGLTEPLFTVSLLGFSHGFSGRDFILLGGGLFLIAKAVHEMHEKLEGASPEMDQKTRTAGGKPPRAGMILAQILVIDIVFSLDSVITAVGMARQIPVMVAAMVLAVGVMLLSARAVGDFVERHPTVKILALSFLLLIGVVLVADGVGQHISKGYIYFAMAFAFAVEMINMRVRKVYEPVHLHAQLEK